MISCCPPGNSQSCPLAWSLTTGCRAELDNSKKGEDDTTIHSLYPHHSCIWKKAMRIQNNLSSYIFHFVTQLTPLCPLQHRVSILSLPVSLLNLSEHHRCLSCLAKPKHFACTTPWLLHSEGYLRPKIPHQG